MNQEKAEQARAAAETWDMVKQSLLGERLEAELAKIEDQAIKGGFMGETPESTNVLMERRGEYRTAQRIRRIFLDIEKEARDAVTWQLANLPTEEPASEETA